MSKVLAALVLLLAVVAIACGDDDDGSPTGTATSDASSTESATGDSTDEPTENATVDPSLSAKILELRIEAENLCPADDLVACQDRFVDYALGEELFALCVDAGDGRWYFEQPEGEVGDSCGDSGTIVAIVGG